MNAVLPYHLMGTHQTPSSRRRTGYTKRCRRSERLSRRSFLTDYVDDSTPLTAPFFVKIR